MAATYTAFLKHDFIGKASQKKPKTAWAHSRYINRMSAAQHTIRHFIPADFDKRRDFYYQHEDSLRKNGRVVDKFTISVPHEIDMFDFAASLENFGLWLGQNNCPFEIAIHGFGSRNHHAHVIFIDRDMETGKRVYGTTERNSTRAIKLEWERVANETFEALGYDVRVKVKDWHEEQANDNEPQHHSGDVTDMINNHLHAPAEEEPEAPSTVDEDTDMSTIERQPREDVSAFVHNVRTLHSTVTELNRLHDAQERLSQARQRHTSLLKQREKAELTTSAHLQTLMVAEQAKHNAEQKLNGLQTAGGKLKGFKVGLFGFSIATPKRKAAEQAQREFSHADMQAEYERKQQEAYRNNVTHLTTEATEAEQAALQYAAQLERLYGTDDDIAQAEKAMTDTIIQAIQDVPLEEATQAWADGAITDDEYRVYLERAGHTEALEAYRLHMEENEPEL